MNVSVPHPARIERSLRTGLAWALLKGAYGERLKVFQQFHDLMPLCVCGQHTKMRKG